MPFPIVEPTSLAAGGVLLFWRRLVRGVEEVDLGYGRKVVGDARREARGHRLSIGRGCATNPLVGISGAEVVMKLT